jgi:hypothetical protein
MLSKRNNRKPRKGRGRPSNGRNRSSVKPLEQWTASELSQGMSQLWNVAQMGISIFNTEVKMYDASIGGAPGITFSNTGVITGLSLIAQGPAYNQREGNSIKFLALIPRFNLVYNAANVYVACRTLIVQDFECLGVAPAVTDILETADINGQYQHISTRRFRILMDWRQNGQSDRLAWFKHDLEELKGETHLAFRDATTNASSQGEGSVWMLMITDAIVNYPVLYGSFRTLYVDN